jgi:hypothetical protein
MSSISDADQLADRLDRVLPPHGLEVPAPAAERDPAVAVALRLARGPHPVLDAEAVARIGARVVAAVDSKPAVRRAAFRPTMGVLRWAAAACLVLVIVVVSTATASARSLPGDTLYPVKRLVEQGQLALASDGGEVTLRLDLAGRRLDEFETLLKRGEVHPETLDDATEEMNSTLALVEDGAGTPETTASRLIDLSMRQARLAGEASTRVDGDPAKAIRLHEAVTEANAVEEAARQLIAPPAKSSVRTVPERFHSRSVQQNLGRDTAVFIPHDSTPEPTTTVDAPTAVFVGPAAPQPPAGDPVVYRPPVVVTSTPPAVDPGTPPTVDPGNPPGDRPVADDPGDLPTVDPGTPTVEPDTPTPDAPPAVEPDTAVPDEPPTVEPDTPTPDAPPAVEPDTPVPEASPVVESDTSPGNEPVVSPPDQPPAGDTGGPPADMPPAVEAPASVPPGDPPQAALSSAGEQAPLPPAGAPPGDPAGDGTNGSQPPPADQS